MLLLAACSQQAQPQVGVTIPSSSDCAPRPKTGTSTGGGVAELVADNSIPRQITFYGDLLPILSSQTSGAVFKCTTCHADYGDPEKMNNVLTVNQIVEALEIGRMPRGGNLMPKAKIQLFRTWQLQGFQVGTIGSHPSAAAEGADASPVCP